MNQTLDLLLPPSAHDPGRPSGGNVYDRELAKSLCGMGVEVREHPTKAADLPATLQRLPHGATVLVDGLLGLSVGRALAREGSRLRLWLLVHLPLSLAEPRLMAGEQEALCAVDGVLTTSEWTRAWLLARYPLSASRVRVAPPGVVPARLTTGSPKGARLVCVGAVSPLKGQHVLVSALATMLDLDWSCDLVGPLDRDPAFTDRVQAQVESTGLTERVRISGPVQPARIGAVYDGADLLVLPTLLETYGMVVTEALARGIPVVASDVGGVPEALGAAPDGALPGVLVRPGDAPALASTLRHWLEDPLRRGELRASARARRTSLVGWPSTAERVREALWDTRSRTPKTREPVSAR